MSSDMYSTNILFQAVHANRVSEVKDFYEKGWIPKYELCHSITWAATAGCVEVLEFVLPLSDAKFLDSCALLESLKEYVRHPSERILHCIKLLLPVSHVDVVEQALEKRGHGDALGLLLDLKKSSIDG